MSCIHNHLLIVIEESRNLWIQAWWKIILVLLIIGSVDVYWLVGVGQCIVDVLHPTLIKINALICQILHRALQFLYINQIFLRLGFILPNFQQYYANTYPNHHDHCQYWYLSRYNLKHSIILYLVFLFVCTWTLLSC